MNVSSKGPSLLVCQALKLEVELVKMDMYQKYEHRKPWFVKVGVYLILNFRPHINNWWPGILAMFWPQKSVYVSFNQLFLYKGPNCIGLDNIGSKISITSTTSENVFFFSLLRYSDSNSSCIFFPFFPFYSYIYPFNFNFLLICPPSSLLHFSLFFVYISLIN